MRPFASCEVIWKTGHDDRGFTLMEIIVVSVLIVVFLSLALPSVRSTLVSSELDTAARKLAGAVTEVRQLAVQEHVAYELTFDISGQRYWYEKEGTVHPFGEQPENLTKLPENAILAKIETTENGVINTGTATLWISKKGYMDQLEIYLRDKDKEQRILYFAPFGGLLRITDGAGNS